MSNTYTKLRNGSWGIRILGGDKPNPGTVVTVTTKAGATKTETIDHVLFTGPDKYHPGVVVHLCGIVTQRRPPVARRSAVETWRGNGCSDCRRRGTWCDRCAFDEFDN